MLTQAAVLAMLSEKCQKEWHNFTWFNSAKLSSNQINTESAHTQITLTEGREHVIMRADRVNRYISPSLQSHTLVHLRLTYMEEINLCDTVMVYIADLFAHPWLHTLAFWQSERWHKTLNEQLDWFAEPSSSSWPLIKPNRMKGNKWICAEEIWEI